jgi:RNA polymerase sigma-70 factor (ECF subfamily)
MTEFTQELEHQIPKLRRYARALTHDAARADDLVQDTLCRALSKSHLWQEGTNLRAWLFTILHNQHVNGVRRTVREGSALPIEDFEASLPSKAVQPHALELRDLHRALARLPEDQRQTILLVGLEGLSYDHAAAVLAVPVGTVRSRLSRGRAMLRQLTGAEAAASAAA